MPTPQIRELTDRESGHMFERSEQGARGVRVFLVDTPDPAAAGATVGIPQAGAAWDGDNLDVLLRRASATPEPGAKPSADGSSLIGWCRIVCEYSTADLAGAGGTIPPSARTPGASYSEYEFGETSTTVFFDILGLPVGGDRGAQVEASNLEIRIRQYAEEAPQPSSFIDLLNTTNQEAISLPPPYGAEMPITLNAGQGLFRTPKLVTTTGPDGEPIVEIIFRIGVAPDWKHRWRKTDAEGNPVGDIIVSTVYESASWAAIFTV